MKFHANEPEEEAEDLLNLTSMIDVVFTLLAFFIITVRIFGVERDAAVGAAARASAAQQLVKGDLPDAVMIRLVENGAAVSRMTIEIGGQSFDEPAAITRQLADINLPDVPVVFASSPNLTVEQVTGAVDAALNSPMRKVSLRALTPDELGTPRAGS
jgi:biopolymer transport protein ExbD